MSDEKILLAAIWLTHNDMLYKISNNLSDAATVVAYRVTAKKNEVDVCVGAMAPTRRPA